jgi:anti-sigma B factor antagonist
MEPVSLATRTEVLDGRTVLSVFGAVDLVSAERLRQAIDVAVNTSPRVTLDVAEMTFIDSTGLSALVYGHRRAQDAGGDLVVRHPSPMLKRLLGITHLDSMLVIEEEDEHPAGDPS